MDQILKAHIARLEKSSPAAKPHKHKQKATIMQYGIVTAKFVAVLEALLWGFHNAASGRCYPSYERIAERAGCTRTTVYTAIRALEAVGILSWCNRLVRVREACAAPAHEQLRSGA